MSQQHAWWLKHTATKSLALLPWKMEISVPFPGTHHLWPTRAWSDAMWLPRLAHSRPWGFLPLPPECSLWEPWAAVWEVWPPWGHHAVRKPKPQGGATWRHSTQPALMNPALVTSQPRQAQDRWRQAPPEHSAPSHLGSPSWGRRCNGAETNQPCGALYYFFPTESRKLIKYLVAWDKIWWVRYTTTTQDSTCLSSLLLQTIISFYIINLNFNIWKVELRLVISTPLSFLKSHQNTILLLIIVMIIIIITNCPHLLRTSCVSGPISHNLILLTSRDAKLLLFLLKMGNRGTERTGACWNSHFIK